MADQRFRGSAVDLARCCRRGAGLRPDAQDQHRQAACPLVVPAGLHALRSHPDNAGNQAASADAALLSNAARPAALRRRFRTGLINEGSREGQILVALGVLDFVDANRMDRIEGAVLQPPLSDMLYGMADLFPGCTKR